MGDREFCSVDLAKWLQQQEQSYLCLRLKRNAYLEIEPEIWVQLQAVGLRPGVSPSKNSDKTGQAWTNRTSISPLF